MLDHGLMLSQDSETFKSMLARRIPRLNMQEDQSWLLPQLVLEASINKALRTF